MFVKTSHPRCDNGWCWAPGVIAPDADTAMGPRAPHNGGHEMPSQASTSHRPSGSKYRNMRRVISDNKLGEKSDCGEGLYPHSKDPFMRNHALWFLDQTLYGKGFVESPERKYLNEQQVSGWTVTKKGTWTVRTERYLLNERRMFRIKPLLTFH